ncbi:TPA: DUF2809 domain-containing protein [Aeromonas veronii]|nr:DUF2809 domain-containing protein [Aeromonas veronii]
MIGRYASGWFWRGFLSDAIVVVLIFSFVQIFSNKSPWKTALAVLMFSYTIEVAQYFNVVDYLDIKNRLLRIAIGNHFDPFDLLAYFVGFLICLYISYAHVSRVRTTSIIPCYKHIK